MSPANSPDIRQVRERVTTELRQAEAQRSSGEEAAMAKATSPTTQQQTATAPSKGSIRWVPLAEVLQGRGMRLAELHAHGQENLVKKMRHGMSQVAASRRGVARQAVNLPPVSTFGQQAPAVQGAAVSA